VVKIEELASSRIRAAISSSVEYPGSSNEPSTSFSSATLIRSAGSFLRRAASPIAAAATASAAGMSDTTSLRRRISVRCAPRVRSESYTAATSSPRPRSRLMCPTTASGTSSSRGKYPSRPKHFA
jgi:hypothetical protein